MGRDDITMIHDRLKRKLLIATACSLVAYSLMACGSSAVMESTDGNAKQSESVGQTDEESNDRDEGSDGTDPIADDQSKDEDEADKGNQSAKNGEDSSALEEENPYDGSPGWESIADSFKLPTHRMGIEEAVSRYAINLVDGGKYADFEGDIGDVIPEYKNKDLDGDHEPDVIKREGKHYVIEFSRYGSLTTGDYSNVPNEGEVFEFEDLGCRNCDEILIAHYTFGTGGSSIWDTSIYSYQNGEWKEYPLVDKNGEICSEDLKNLIEKETGEPYESWSVRVAGAQMSALLLDFGKKDGAGQTWDYRRAYLSRDFMGDPDAEKDYSCSGIYRDIVLINTWPFELTGEQADLPSGLQHDLNLFLSNFSEQNYGGDEWPVSLAHFALAWSELNDSKTVVYLDDKKWISHSKINTVLIRYFNTNLEEGDLGLIPEDNPYHGRIEYHDDNTWYTEPMADGEMFKNNAFTVVTGLQRIPSDYNSCLRAEYTIYSLTEDEYLDNGIDRKYYSLSAAEAKKLFDENKLYQRGAGFAIINDTGGLGDKDDFRLDYYTVY